jgi:hypothetical protein
VGPAERFGVEASQIPYRTQLPACGRLRLGTWQEPPVYAIVARDRHAIHFRCAEPPAANPDKYAHELLDAYLVIEDADALYAEYTARGVQFTRLLVPDQLRAVSGASD